jgi:hypothetical protein
MMDGVGAGARAGDSNLSRSPLLNPHSMSGVLTIDLCGACALPYDQVLESQCGLASSPSPLSLQQTLAAETPKRFHKFRQPEEVGCLGGGGGGGLRLAMVILPGLLRELPAD